MSTLIITEEAAKKFIDAARQPVNIVRPYDKKNPDDMDKVAELLSLGMVPGNLDGLKLPGCIATFRLFESVKGFQLRVADHTHLQEARTFINQK